jgi:hypothetical protein
VAVQITMGTMILQPSSPLHLDVPARQPGFHCTIVNRGTAPITLAPGERVVLLGPRGRSGKRTSGPARTILPGHTRELRWVREPGVGVARSAVEVS